MAALTGALVRVAAEPGRTVEWPSAERPAYPTSPYHGVRDGNGEIIPCRCRFQGQEYRLGELACLSMPSGTVLARCDLVQNNTSWVATATPCTVSSAPLSREHASLASSAPGATR
jgi:hypothetical protein